MKKSIIKLGTVLHVTWLSHHAVKVWITVLTDSSMILKLPSTNESIMILYFPTTNASLIITEYFIAAVLCHKTSLEVVLSILIFFCISLTLSTDCVMRVSELH